MKEFKDFVINRFRQERTLAHESGHTPPDIDAMPEDQEITLWDSKWLDELSRHNEIYNQSVTFEEDPRLDPTG
jgi:hypothetical protein